MSTPYTPTNSKQSSIVTPGGGSDSVTLPNNNLSRALPRQISTGTMRGTQNVGYGSAQINSSKNIISVGSSAGTQGLGTVPNTSVPEYGFFQTDSSGKIIWKLVGGTAYTYNAQDNYNNSILNGFAPDDGRPGIWVAKTGQSAEDLLN